MANWTFLTKEQINEEKDICLPDWLCIEASGEGNPVFEYELGDESLKASLKKADGTKIRNIVLGYQYREDISKEESVNINASDVGEFTVVDLKNSGYLRVVHACTKDGKYYYYKEYEEGEQAYYPFSGQKSYEAVYSEKAVRNNETLTDYIEIYGEMEENQSVRFVYTTEPGRIPILTDESFDKTLYAKGKEADEVYYDEKQKRWIAKAVFSGESQQLCGVWVVNDRAYEACSSKVYTGNDREILPAPDAYMVSRYYEDNAEMKRAYVDETQDAFLVCPGQKVKIKEYAADVHKTGCEYYYLFSNTRLTDEDIINQQTLRYQEENGDSNITVPDGYPAGSSIYLHIRKSKADMPGVLKVLTLTIGEERRITASLDTETYLISGIHMTFDLKNLETNMGMEGIRYLISDKKEVFPNLLEQYNPIKYTPQSKITLMRQNDEMSCYVYAQFYGHDSQGNAVCSKITELVYFFQEKIAVPEITPNTVAGTNAAGAYVCEANTAAYLNAPDSDIIVYSGGTEESSSNLHASVVTDETLLVTLNAGRENHTVRSGRLYVKSNGMWYELSADAMIYQPETGIPMENKKDEPIFYYIGAIAFQEGKGESDPVRYVYKLNHVEQAAAPTAVLSTSKDDPAGVGLDSFLFFQSATPDAELYYTTNGTRPAITEGGDTKQYDPETGIQVKGDYNGLFKITLIAVKKDADGNPLMKQSEEVTYTYKIMEQEKAAAPSSIPATSDENPTMLAPGEKILLSTVTQGALIYFTTDGSDPVVIAEEKDDSAITASNGTLYDQTKGVVMPESGDGFFTIKAVAVKKGMAVSEVVQLVFDYPDQVRPPYALPKSRTVKPGTTVTLGSATENAVIYFESSYGGKKPPEPTISSAIYDSAQPFVIEQRTTIKAFAMKDEHSEQDYDVYF